MGLKTVERIGPLLDLFTADRQEWELGEIAAALGIPRSTAHGLLRSLVSTGLLATPARGRYQLGTKIAALNGVLTERVDVRAEASGTIRALSEELGETVNLGVLRGNLVVYLDKVAGYQYVTVVGARVGAQVDATRSAMGKVLLAHSAPRDPSPLDVGAGEPADLTGLHALAAIRAQGYALDLGEITPEIRCVAAPVKNATGQAVAALSISTTPMRFERRRTRLVESVVEAAAAVQERIALLTAS
ncbi:IclR family transcriptional regulator [Amycolatopsis rhabdoformis]|uniref:IclR family transcriptional regulator n=1 Tax=Amycolatopsis rhabdoformis TaxID=1448059 RepID=A0ABZ1IJU2_9PSEU|nr:IclR family transcriptional regulator [Amycolatopsis rhabdoformis]WSE34754.1 IclR family transcriptional regulator [Amycolatopsis rhabdoformis]